ncbi:hypothetical protein C1646_663991 [Rhizophagus diaphanus]|nr:hypothetical protein C1646_663991 [Rhizophagus diaphanus] [Rhizophagus sp. MUCL 43196]
MTKAFKMYIEEENIKYYDYNEFINIEDLGNNINKANWRQGGKLVALKSLSLNDKIAKEIVQEIKIQENDFNNVMMKLYGITKNDSDEHLLVVEYAEGGSLNNYLKTNFPSLNWMDKYRLALQLSSAMEHLHERGIVHKGLHSRSILIQQNSIRLADSGLSKRIKDVNQISLYSPYVDPRGIDIEAPEKYELNEKSDIYSVGVLLWELSSGKIPFADKKYDSLLAKEIAQGLREVIVKGTPEEYYILYERCWDGDPGKRPKIQEVVVALKLMMSSLNLGRVQQLKLNYGLFLNGYSIEPSKQAVFVEDGELNMTLYEGQPLVYTSINDHNSHVNLLSFNSDDNDVELNEPLRSSDICINFPVAEITYTANLSESFSNFMDEEKSLCEIYGHLFPRKILIGGKLFIDDLNSATLKQIDTLKFFLTWAYNSVKHKKETPFNNLSVLNFFPKMVTLDGQDLNTCEKLINWMKNLYQVDITDTISYNDLVPISQLKFDSTSSIDEKLPGIANYEKKLNLDDWVGDSLYINLIRWVEEYHLLHGLIIDQKLEIGISKETAIDLIDFLDIDPSNKFNLEIVKPATTLEEILINNNIFAATNDNLNIGSFPFIKVSDSQSNENYAHFLLKFKRYNISLDKDNIKPSEKFKQAIEKALESMKPLKCLQKVFNEYGHFFPLNVILGKSLKNTIENSFSPPKNIDLVLPIFESIKPHLAEFNISCLLTQKGEIIEDDLSEWIQITNDSTKDLEIVEYNKIISLYEILEVEQKNRIDIVLNKQDNFKIIMAGCASLKDLDISKQVTLNIEPSLENKNYEVFGTIISKDNLKSDNIFVTFGSYEINKFSVTIKTLENENINMEEYYLLWMIIGNPSKLSVFCLKNRELEVDYIKESITLKHNTSYSIKTSRQLSQGFEISINCFEPINIKLTGWSKNSIHLNILNSNINSQIDKDNIDISICVLNSNNENSKIAINGKRYSMGYILTENNYLELMSKAQKYLKDNYPTKKEREKETRLVINKKNLDGCLDLSDFINLEKIDCSENQITSLDISKNKLLIDINCSNNKLTSLDLRNCLNIKSVTANCNQLNELKLPDSNSEKLEYLNLLDNSFSQNLNCFSHLVNLKELLIGNIDVYRIQQGKYNQFYGSLEPLKSLIKLESLSIVNSDIDSGLEFLSDSMKNFRCLADIIPEAKVKIIYEKLKDYTLSPNDAFQGRYNLKAWKVNWQLTKEKKDLQDQITQIEEELSLNTKFIELIEKENNLNTEKENLIENNIQIKEEIKKLKQKVEELNDKLEQKEIAYQQIKQQLKDKEELLKSYTIEQCRKKEELHKEIDVLKEDLENKKNDIEQLEMQLEEINRELEIKENESESLKSKLNEIELSKSDIKNRKDELKDLKQKLDHERHFTKADTSELRSQINDLKKVIKLLQSQALKSEKIKNELEEIRKAKEALQDEQNIKQTHIEKLQNDRDNLQYKLGVRINELNDKKDIISELKQQSKQRIEELENKLNEEIKKYQDSNNKLQKKNTLLKAKLEKIRKDCEEDITSDTN